MDNNKHLNWDTIDYLQNALLEINQYIQLYLYFFQVLETTPSEDIQIRLIADPTTDLWRYNAPLVNEIAVILPSDHSQFLNPCNIILHDHEGGVRFIHDHHYSYAPLHYILLFPYGTPNWTYGLPHQHDIIDNAFNPNQNQLQTNKHITQIQFYLLYISCTHNKTNFPFYSMEANCFNNTYAIYGSQLINAVCDWLRLTNHSYGLHYMVASKMWLNMVKPMLLSLTLGIAWFSLSLTVGKKTVPMFGSFEKIDLSEIR